MVNASTTSTSEARKAAVRAGTAAVQESMLILSGIGIGRSAPDQGIEGSLQKCIRQIAQRAKELPLARSRTESERRRGSRGNGQSPYLNRSAETSNRPKEGGYSAQSEPP